jgi:hypothetical protein
MGRTDYNLSGLPGVVDPHNTPRDNGHQIDWANVADSYKNADGKKVLPALTAVGTLLGGGKVSPRVVTTNPAVGLLATAAVEGEDSAAATGYGMFVGGAFYENLLPDATGGPPKTLDADIKTELEENGTGWVWRTYSDNRA